MGIAFEDYIFISKEENKGNEYYLFYKGKDDKKGQKSIMVYYCGRNLREYTMNDASKEMILDMVRKDIAAGSLEKQLAGF